MSNEANADGFREEARRWLALNAPPFELPKDSSAPRLNDVKAVMEMERSWRVVKADGGYAGFAVPEEYGGRGTPGSELTIFDEEERKYNLPRSGVFHNAEILAGPMIQFGRPEQCHSHIRRMLRGDEIWCQLLSEPSAGSDFAGLRTKAVRDGDDWIINGQKIWNSFAQYADWGTVIVRTDPTVPKHLGLSCFLLDMRTPGVDVRPIRQISGRAEFNEVFLTDVRVPHAQLLGKLGDGWKIFIASMRSDRLSTGDMPHFYPDLFDKILDLTQHLDIDGHRAIDDGRIRSKLADWYMKGAGVRYLHEKISASLSNGGFPGAEASVNKLVLGLRLQEMSAFAMDVIGPGGSIADRKVAPLMAAVQEQFLESFMFRIGGGTDDINKNTLAEQVLGLPRDIRTDRDVPFNELIARRA